jgi:hypothetical protein
MRSRDGVKENNSLKNKSSERLSTADRDRIIDEITVDANGEDEQLWAFRQAFEADVAVPCAGSVLGQRITVSKFDYDGNQRRGLTAYCLRGDGREYIVAASDVVLDPDTQGARYVAAYRKWMGLAPSESEVIESNSSLLYSPVELVVLSVKRRVARCRWLESGQTVILRARRLWEVFPSEIAVVKPAKRWTYDGNPYLSGEIERTRLDIAALGLVPLQLEQQGTWDPTKHYWGEEGEAIEEWAKPIIARGKRAEFEMEQVIPGFDPEDPNSDPIGQSNDLRDAGDADGAYQILMNLCQADLRCLDAHAHLGNFSFERRPQDAIRHYEAGYRIGEWSLGEGFEALLPWGWVDNRPFLRCMHGFGLCLWRLGRFDDASRVFNRMLLLNPSDNQGVRFLMGAIRSKKSWRDSQKLQ